MQEAGATADIELGYTLADGLEYIRTGIAGRPGHRRLRPAPQLLLGHRHEPLHGDRQDCAPRASCGPRSSRSSIPKNPKSMALRTHSPDLRLEPDRAGCLQQRAAHLRRSDGRGPGPYPVAAHQRARRSHRAAHRFFRAHRAQHADLPAGRDRNHTRRRSVGRQLLRRSADPRADAQGLAPHPGNRDPWRHDQGHRNRLSQRCVSRKPPRAGRR